LLKNILTYCGYLPTSPFVLLLSEHKHRDNAATNSNSENARSRMVGKLAGKRGYGNEGRWVNYWTRLGCCISPLYGPFWLGARFWNLWTVSLIFQIFVGPRQTVDTEVRLYILCNPTLLVYLFIRYQLRAFHSQPYVVSLNYQRMFKNRWW
jgi:hypothetical protein